MGSWTSWFLDFNKRGAWNNRGGAKFGLFLINVVVEITELWVENSQKINCRDVTSIREGRVNTYKQGKQEKQFKRFNKRGYSLFFLMGIFLKRLWLISNTLKWQDCKIWTELLPSHTPSYDLQNLITTSSFSDFRGDIFFL